MTAISLPTKVQNEEESYDDLPISKQVTGSSKLKNPSCPSITPKLKYSSSVDDDCDSVKYRNDYQDENWNITSRNSRQIQKQQSQRKSNHNNNNSTKINEKYETLFSASSTSKFADKYVNDINNSHGNLPIKITGPTETNNSNATLNSQNSKTETVLGLKTTLFTTKYECIGQNKTGSDSSIKNIPDSSQISVRSKSVTNVNDKINNEKFTINQMKTTIVYNNRSNIINNDNKTNNTSNNNSPNNNSNLNLQKDTKNNSLISLNTITIRNKIIEKFGSNWFSNNNNNAATINSHHLNEDNNNNSDYMRNHHIKNTINNKYNSNGNIHHNGNYANNNYNNNNNDNYNYNKNTNQTSHNFISINENIYIGNMGCIKNERKMCRLNIEYLIDMTNMRPDDLNRQTLGKLPCLCKTQHSRSYLAIELADTSYKTLFNSFAEVNKFISKARRANKKVLIFSKEFFQQHLICACAQYLMLEYEMNLDNALNTISKRLSTSTLYIEKCYLDYLKNYESYLQHLSINLYGSNGRVLNRGNSITMNDEFISSTNTHLKPNMNEENSEDKSFDSSNYDDDEEDEDDDESTRNAKKQTQRFSVLPASGAIDIEARRNQANSLKQAWM